VENSDRGAYARHTGTAPLPVWSSNRARALEIHASIASSVWSRGSTTLSRRVTMLNKSAAQPGAAECTSRPVSQKLRLSYVVMSRVVQEMA